MPNIFPGAVWRPMPGQESRPKRRKGRGVGFHIAVYEGSSIYNINLGTGNDAHLFVRRDGTCEQNVDLDLQAWAGADGNGSMIWVETQGGTTATDVKSGVWTGPQFETLARIAAWAHQTEGVPLQVMPDSRSTSRGIGTHRLGIQHSLGIGAVPGWLISGGERWSKVIGKECPGDARVRQVPQIVARAQQIVNGDTDLDANQAQQLQYVYDVLKGGDPTMDTLSVIYHRLFTDELNSLQHHGNDADNVIGHVVSAHKYAKAALDGLAKLGGTAPAAAAAASGPATLSAQDKAEIIKGVLDGLKDRLQS